MTMALLDREILYKRNYPAQYYGLLTLFNTLSLRNVHIYAVYPYGLIVEHNRHSIKNDVDNSSVSVPSYRFNAYYPMTGNKVIQINAFMRQFVRYYKIIDASSSE